MRCVDVALTEEADERTLLRLEHLAHIPDELWDQFGPGAGGIGWDQTLFGLQQHLATGETLSPEDAMAWLASDEGLLYR